MGNDGERADQQAEFGAAVPAENAADEGGQDADGSREGDGVCRPPMASRGVRVSRSGIIVSATVTTPPRRANVGDPVATRAQPMGA